MTETPRHNIQHPGLELRSALKSRKITQKDFATMIDMQPSHLSEIIKGKRVISKTLASKLESALGRPASHWIQLQAKYDYDIATQKTDDDFEHLAEQMLMDYDELYDMKLLFKKLGVANKSSSERLNFCKNELGFEAIAIQKKVRQGYYRRSEKTGLDMRKIATWSAIAMYEASKLPRPIGVFNRNNCDTIAKELASIFNDNDNTINKVARTLSNYGIKFCIVEKVSHASIDGFSFYNNGTPCIVVTKRFNRIDNFAFAILHELGHIKFHLQANETGKVNVVDPDIECIAKDEQEANAFASNALIPQNIWKEQPSVNLFNPRSVQTAFTKFAKAHKLNKWIVLGRVSFETNIFFFKSDISREIH